MSEAEPFEQYKKRVFDFADSLRRGDMLRDTESGRVGRYSGEQQTSFPPNFGVSWLHDGEHAFIKFRNAERVPESSADDEDLDTPKYRRPAEPSTPVVEGLGMLNAHSLPSLNIERLDKDAMQNTLSSMMAMADAQRRRFDAAGVLVLVFDATGMGLTCFSRPERGGISDEYVREQFAQLAGVEPTVRRVKAKKKR